ncbi:GNAT family N-acetyltransferase [Methylobacterium sp. E-041]|jgi:RimJ/RimL family protein N-acetyltransferase|uniref:GNAT family N-acetyltransferase n=1 Tax=unclassified Methylobacterium TaxID=2615210 RepID=UPI0011CCA703|nr:MULTISPECIES: GNAT family N-acetyltransferase [unclassified Methylobacterium]MCJ2007779.1 GNAT family N-acetyltransferase [Methylobacterium sp. J-092]MCJ2037890.1 GNAT family N-acetyltransferase [Methylobacterium sp. J-059]MCJ2078090.1 GNAT family N-acetyltransferase [Methylobacterium sp. E-016]MCJ2106834.1 GNAT family N-acetyltransferase [Methylobacterium sp. E-041]MCJ2112784.1 GNAT family N-acetyltransferase [Methylobacterium sp. E-025]
MFFRRARSDSLCDLPGLETARLSIDVLIPGDAEALRSLTDDPAITGAVDFLPAPFTLEDARRLIASGRRREDRFFGARTREGRTLVGVVGTHLRGTEAVEIGYWVGGAARGRGLATEAVSGILGSLSLRFPARTIVAECRPGNVASWGLLTKLGFRDTGEEGHRPGRRLMARRAI